ncbi:hypothetical protein DID75_05445 [Candidatus Marinamargulisbacteria bacterium SCGC AG-410-N11]|nr:hypothetical protein DID75_05445 [Candidatus Marinamargulisbacteria bacterium SCGC AG-410-N11]
MKPFISNISLEKALELIDQLNLKPYFELWHFTFNISYFYTNFKFIHIGKRYLLFPTTKLNQWSPFVIFSNFELSLEPLSKHNQHNPFWFYKLSTFENFLTRRSNESHKPKKHFPSLETYPKLQKKLDVSFDIINFSIDNFTMYYDNLKRPDHDSATTIMSILLKNYPGLTQNWLRLALLKQDNNVLAIALIIDDGKSISLQNIASKMSSHGYGVFLCVEILKYYSSKQYYSFDAGISAQYGCYKNKIFLDSVYTTPLNNLPYSFKLLNYLFHFL